MPEGDTIHRTANALRKVLLGKVIHSTAGWDSLIDHASLRSAVVEDIEARGKHLLVRLDDGRVIHGHCGMTGSWHIYSPMQQWIKPERRAALVLGIEGAVVVYFNPKLLELLSPDAARRNDWLRNLGPDLLAQQFNAQEIVARFRTHNSTPIGEAVMDQRICCGIGNIYKSELLFLQNIDPFVPVAKVSDQSLGDLLELARELLQFNLQGAQRTTRMEGDGGRLWAYGRRGESCYLCGSDIHMARQGDAGRSTYWCPDCQSAAGPNKQPPSGNASRRRPPIKGCG